MKNHIFKPGNYNVFSSFVVYLCYFIACLHAAVTETKFSVENLVVSTETGSIRGVNITAFPSNQTTIGFLSIPIAESTEGVRRFALPEVPQKWTGIRDATKYGAACVADPVLTYKTDAGGPISEDCLQANVFTNQHCVEKGNCTVLVIIHGGKFNFESPVIFPQATLANNFVAQDRNIVVVTLPFRLGVFGWMNLSPETKSSAPRNIALHDILHGLRWIQRNIHNFGGLPANVTLLGHSSGGGIVDMLSLSPKSEGLFNQVVAMSGASGYLGSEINQNVNVQASLAIADHVGCYKRDPLADKMLNYKLQEPVGVPAKQVETVLSCMRKLSYQKLLDAQTSLYSSTEDFYGPSLDDDVLPMSFDELLKNRIPRRTLLGTLSAESKMTIYIENADGTPDPTKLREICLHLGWEMAFEDSEGMAQKCQEFYTNEFRARELFDHLNFNAPVAQAANSLTKNGAEVFVYSYSYNGALGAFKNITNVPLDRRPMHSEDYIYVVGIHRGPFTAKDYENEMVYSGIIADFVNGKLPYAGWKPWNRWSKRYFDINFNKNLLKDGPQMGYYTKAIEFWSEKNLGKHVQPTSFPPSFDAFLSENLVTALESHHTQVSTAHDKTFEAEENIYWQWTTWLANARKGIKKPSKTSVELRALTTEDPILVTTVPPSPSPTVPTAEGVGVWAILLTLVIITAISGVLFLIVRKCIAMRKRYEYYELLN